LRPCFYYRTNILIVNSLQYVLAQNFLDPADRAAGQAHLDTVRMGGRFGQDVLDHAFGQFAGELVLFQDDTDFQAWFDIAAKISVHALTFPSKNDHFGQTYPWGGGGATQCVN